MERRKAEFFTQHPVECARELVGDVFFWKGCSGTIVETEAYHWVDDEACHTWHRPSARAYIEEHKAGDAYVYLNYGVHWLFNMLVKGEEGCGFVLIRALEPLEGVAEMMERRGAMKETNLTTGPGKLTRALGIDGNDHGADFLSRDDCGIFAQECGNILTGPRIGISKAVDLPWRFGKAGSRFLSRKF